VRRLHCFRL